MSGLFKNFDKLISAQSLSTPNHRYLLKSIFTKYCPTQLYLQSGEQLKPGHGRDVFELSLISYQLTKQQAVNKEMLGNLHKNEEPAFYNELTEKQEYNAQYISDAIKEIQLQLSVGITDTPVAALTSLTYILGQQQQKDTAMFNSYIKPQLLEKIQYTSQQNLIDLVSGLANLQIYDTAIWNKVLERLENKVFDWQHEEVAHHGWEVTTYEQIENPVSTFFTNRLSHTERYYQDIIAGNGGSFSQLKRNVFWAFDELYLRLINPLFFRENRGSEFVYQHQSDVERQSLFTNLEKVSAKVPQASKTLVKVQSNA